MDEDEPDGTESEAPPEPVSGSLKWWRLQKERPTDELRSDPEIQMQLYRMATEAAVLNTNLPITLELTLIQRVYGIKPDDLEDMSVPELIQLQNDLNKREKEDKNSLTKYRHSTLKRGHTGIGVFGVTPYEEPYNPGWFQIPVQRWLNSDLPTQRIGQPDIPTLVPSEEFHRFTYGSETFVLNDTEAPRAEMLWNAKARDNRRVRTDALLGGTGYDKVRNLFQSKDGVRFYAQFINNDRKSYWLEDAPKPKSPRGRRSKH